MTKRAFSTLLLIAFLFLSACSSPQPTTSPPTGGEEIPATQAPSYPGPAAPAADSGYPGPAAIPKYDPYPGSETSQGLPTPSTYATSGPMPEPGPDSGVVTGKLLANGKPALNASLYLAEVSTDAQGKERVASYSQSDSPRAFVDPEGKFVFANIPPGRYGIVLDTVLAAYLLHDPNQDTPLLITVVAGKTTDLGDLNYDSLPMHIPDN